MGVSLSGSHCGVLAEKTKLEQVRKSRDSKDRAGTTLGPKANDILPP